MSMYPPPYQPPNAVQYYAAPVDPLAPAKRASLMMFIVSGFMILGSTCMLSMPSIVHTAPAADTNRLHLQLHDQFHVSLETFLNAMTIAGVVGCLLGLTLFTLAFFVRRGGRRACIAAAVLAGLIEVYWIGNFLSCLVMGMIPGVCTSVLLAGAFGLLLTWLIQTIRVSNNTVFAQQQYAAQYWQYQQNMQTYANAGYGYAQQPQLPQQTPPPPPINPETPPIENQP